MEFVSIFGCTTEYMNYVNNFCFLGARNIRKNILDNFIISYLLKTTKAGAIVREWPSDFSVWKEDPSASGGYAHLKTFARNPPRDIVDELYEVRIPLTRRIYGCHGFCLDLSKE